MDTVYIKLDKDGNKSLEYYNKERLSGQVVIKTDLKIEEVKEWSLEKVKKYLLNYK